MRAVVVALGNFDGVHLGHRAVLARAVEEARARGYRRIELETRTIYREAVHLYEATGWLRGPDLPPEHGPDRTYALDL